MCGFWGADNISFLGLGILLLLKCTFMFYLTLCNILNKRKRKEGRKGGRKGGGRRKEGKKERICFWPVGVTKKRSI